MLERASATHTLGLERVGSHVRGVVLHYRRRQVVCEGTFVLDGANGDDTMPPLFLTEGGKALERQVHQALVVTAIDGSQTIVRQLEVKLKKQSDIDAVLSFQAEPVLPFTAEEARIDRVFLDHTEDGTRLALLAVKREQLATHLAEWENLGIEPEIVGSIPHALSVWMATFQPEQEQPVLLLHIGFAYTNCVLIAHGRLLAAQSYRGGIKDLSTAYQHDTASLAEEYTDNELLKVDFNNLDAKALPTLKQKFIQLQRDAVRTAFGLVKYAHIGDVQALVITGEGSLYPTLSDALSKAIGKPLLTVSAPVQLGLDNKAMTRLAVPIGLALTALPQDTSQINFRQQEQAYPHPWKRLRWPLTLALALCSMLALSVYFFGQAYLSDRTYTLQSAYVDLVSDLKRDYNDIEKRLNDNPEAEITPPIALDAADLDQRLALFERENTNSPDTIALFPHVPRVSDVLAWLSSHPQVVIDDNAAQKTNASIQIDSFNYRMVKRPELNKQRDRYQVQVELEFSSQSARSARLFYDSLIAPNAMVDPKGEVKWTAANGKYRVSFFVKDKTHYPNF
jgi:type IV pilus assembly protein PilM